MEPLQTYILIAVIILLVIAVLVIFVKKNRKHKTLTPLAGLSFAFILAGIVFGENRLTGYSLMGIGVLLVIIDIIKKVKK